MSNKCNNLTGKEWLQNSFSIWRDVCKTKDDKAFGHPASYSVALCEKLLKTFGKNGINVLDPFVGIGSTLVAIKNIGCFGVGIDLSADFCDIARKRVEDSDNIKVIEGDSVEILAKIEPNIFDICITSPPYWDILNMKRSADNKNKVSYSSSTIDIGNIENYQDFLKKLQLIFSQVHRVLKKDSYCIVNVMDIRKKSTFYPLHMDFTLLMKDIGFIFDDIIIWDRQQEYNNMRPLGYPSRFRINKVHEYLLIFIK